jgi:porin
LIGPPTALPLGQIGATLGMALAMLFLGDATRAEPAATHPEPWLTGTWGGYRTDLFDKGVDLQVVYVTESAYNAAGGIRQLVDYTDQVAFGTTLDLERIFGLHDALVQITYTSRAGRNLVEDAQLGTFQLVQEVYGRGQTVRLTQMWFEQMYLNRTVSWRLGRMSFGGEFATFPCGFQNLTFCGSQPGNLVGGYIFNWPISQWGSRVKVVLDGFGYYQVGVFDQNQQYLGFDNKLWPVWYQGSTGVLVPVEVAWQPKFFGDWLAGSYKFGAWYSSGQQPDAVYDSFGNPFALSGQPPATRQGLYGAYVSFQQQITRSSIDNPNRGLRVFFNAAFADTVTATTDRQIAAGFWYTGPLEVRPSDEIAFAMGTTHQNQRITQVASLQNALGLGPVPVKDSEYVFELDYTLEATPGLRIRPNVQYIYSPGGSSITKDVWVLGLKTIISF